MHLDLPSAPTAIENDTRHWTKTLTRYHWFVLIVCTLGWLFDTMDQSIFNLARRPAMMALVDSEQVTDYGYYATSIFLCGWGLGGIAFGVLGDLIGRAKSMILTILLYSAFTGLSALSGEFWQFAVFRFLTGLGVGGQFAVGVSLVAEEMPDRARPFAIGLLQAMSAVGNIMAALAGVVLAFLARDEVISETWRIMFVVGTLPALLVLVIMRRLKEPEKWVKMAASKTISERMGAYGAELFSDPRWKRNAILGLILCSSGIIGLWAIGFFSFDLQQAIFTQRLVAERGAKLEQYRQEQKQKITSTFSQDEEKDLKAMNGEVTFQVGLWAAMTSVMFNIGGFFGMYSFSRVTHYLGRRLSFAIGFVLALLSTLLVFWKFENIGDIFWMIPIMGFCQLSLFGGFAIYLPELFPTRLRGSGTSFGYNGGRFVVAAATLGMPQLHGYFMHEVHVDDVTAFRYVGMIMCSIFLVGIAVLPFAPETKGKPLPE